MKLTYLLPALLPLTIAHYFEPRDPDLDLIARDYDDFVTRGYESDYLETRDYDDDDIMSFLARSGNFQSPNPLIHSSLW